MNTNKNTNNAKQTFLKKGRKQNKKGIIAFIRPHSFKIVPFPFPTTLLPWYMWRGQALS